MIKLSSIAICEFLKNAPALETVSSIRRTKIHHPTSLNFFWYIFKNPCSGRTEELVGYHNGNHIFTLGKYESQDIPSHWEADFCDPYITGWYPLLTQLTKKTILNNLLG